MRDRKVFVLQLHETRTTSSRILSICKCWNSISVGTYITCSSRARGAVPARARGRLRGEGLPHVPHIRRRGEGGAGAAEGEVGEVRRGERIRGVVKDDERRGERSAGGNGEIVGVVAPLLGDTTWRASQGMYPEKQDHMCNIAGYIEVCGGDK